MDIVYFIIAFLCMFTVSNCVPVGYTIDPDNDFYTSCMCYENDEDVNNFMDAFKSLKFITTRFIMHFRDTRFYNNSNVDNMCLSKSNEFKHFINSANSSFADMNTSINALKPELDAIASDEDFYKWMVVITGYTIMREYESIMSSLV